MAAAKAGRTPAKADGGQGRRQGRDSQGAEARRPRRPPKAASRRRPRSCSAPPRRRRRWPPGPSASTPRAASPAPRRCPSTARPGRPCGCRATATGAIPTSIALVEKLAVEAKEHDGWPGPPGRRHLAAARRADAHGPCQPPGRARCRRLVHADAGPAPHREGARGALRHLDAGRRPRVGQPQGVDRGARAPPEARRLLQAGGAGAGAPGHQEGGVRGRPRTRRTATG